MLALKIGWRNLLRNPKRTWITATAIVFTTTILIASLALMDGMMQQMITSATRVVVGDVQIHAPNYLKERSIYDIVPNWQELMTKIETAGFSASPRAYAFGLISHGFKSAGATFVGIDPAKEKATFELPTKLAKGAFIADQPLQKVVIGSKLAKSLDADVGTELVAVVQAADGSLGNALFHVEGVFSTVGERIDRSAVYLHQQDFERLFDAKNMIHEIAVYGRGTAPNEVILSIGGTASQTQWEMKTWKQLLPGVGGIVNIYTVAVFIFAFVFLLAAGVGVLNTMLMATHDRVREFGVLKALGSTPWRIVRDVTIEGLVLALMSTLVGALFGIGLSLYLQMSGINLLWFTDTSFGFGGIAWDPLWRARLRFEHIWVSMLSMWLACVLASLYPAIKAARLLPAKAMTHV